MRESLTDCHKKIDSLQALRAIGFVCIFLIHSDFSKGFGRGGVALFFSLSGFLMILHYSDRTFTVSDAFRKIWKLYPLHIITMLSAVGVYCYKENYGWLLRRICAHVCLLHGLFPIKKIAVCLNGPSWFLSTILVLYCCFPLVKRVLLKADSALKLFGVMILAYAYQWGLLFLTKIVLNELPLSELWDESVFIVTYVSPLSRIGDFVIGGCVALLFKKRYCVLEKRNSSVTLFTVLEGTSLIAFFLLMAFWMHLVDETEIFATVCFVPISTIVVFLFAANRGIFTKLLTNRFTIALGELSDVTFLIHSQVISWAGCLLWSNEEHTKWIMIPSTFCLTLLLAVGYKKLTTVIANRRKR